MVVVVLSQTIGAAERKGGKKACLEISNNGGGGDMQVATTIPSGSEPCISPLIVVAYDDGIV